ncbi:MAG: M81 family metallopeptidase [Pirellulaceae bacterium]
MKIASGGVQHETNTFSDTPTTLSDFQRDSGCGPDFSGGEVLEERFAGTGTIHGGYLAGAAELDVELLPLLSARAQPAGRVEQVAYDQMLNLFLQRLAAVLPVDAVALDLHGAMATQEHDDAEGHFIAAVRELVGPEIPLVVTLDLHANISPQMAAEADVIIGFDTYPHVDMRERGIEAIQLLVRMINQEIHPCQSYRQLPLMTMPPMQCTLREPMQSLIQEVFTLEEEPGILTATVAMGFPFADIRDAGVSVLVTSDSDQTLADQKADALAARLWVLRDQLQPQLTTIEAAIQYTDEHADGLVIFADGSDNPGGGAPCDGTVALQAMIEADFQGGVVGVLHDPDTAREAHAAGVGAEIDAVIGGKTDDQHGASVVTRARVQALSDGKYVHHGAMMRGLVGDFGPMAVLRVGGVEVVVATYRRQLLDRDMLRVVDIDPQTRRLLVVKSAVHFRADLGPLASKIFDADTPGIHRPDFSGFEYQQVRRPIYPLDQDISDPPGA